MTDLVTSPRYIHLVDEMEQIGFSTPDANRIVLLSIGAVKFGDQVPWYAARTDQIKRLQGSMTETVEYVCHLAAALVLNDPELSLADAAKQAGNEFRASIRSQHDYRSGDLEFDVTSIDHEEYMDALRFGVHGEDMDASFTHGRLGLVVEDEYPSLAEPNSMDEIRLELIEDALEQLTERQRQVFDLRVGSRLSWADIGEITGMSRQNAAAAYQQAVRRIRKEVGA